jgi:hypothetical protein
VFRRPARSGTAEQAAGGAFGTSRRVTLRPLRAAADVPALTPPLTFAPSGTPEESGQKTSAALAHALQNLRNR